MQQMDIAYILQRGFLKFFLQVGGHQFWTLSLVRCIRLVPNYVIQSPVKEMCTKRADCGVEV